MLIDEVNQKKIDETLTLGLKYLPHHRRTRSMLVTNVGAPKRGGTTSGPQAMDLTCRKGSRHRYVTTAGRGSSLLSRRSNTWPPTTRVIGYLHHRSWMRHEEEDGHRLRCRHVVGCHHGVTRQRRIHPLVGVRASKRGSHWRRRAPPRSHLTAVRPPISGRAHW
jgi:hypothetical protein